MDLRPGSAGNLCPSAGYQARSIGFPAPPGADLGWSWGTSPKKEAHAQNRGVVVVAHLDTPLPSLLPPSLPMAARGGGDCSAAFAVAMFAIALSGHLARKAVGISVRFYLATAIPWKPGRAMAG